MADGSARTGVDVRPLSGHTGAEIRGLDLTQPVGDQAIADIRAALLKWKVVFFREQELGHAEQIAFAKRFGDVTYAHPHEDDPIEGFPEILPIHRQAQCHLAKVDHVSRLTLPWRLPAQPLPSQATIKLVNLGPLSLAA